MKSRRAQHFSGVKMDLALLPNEFGSSAKQYLNVFKYIYYSLA
jgi:hypothetical protein